MKENRNKAKVEMFSVKPIEMYENDDGEIAFGLSFSADGLLPLMKQYAEMALLTRKFLNGSESGDDVGAMIDCRLVISRAGQIVVDIKNIGAKPGFIPFGDIYTGDMWKADRMKLAMLLIPHCFQSDSDEASKKNYEEDSEDNSEEDCDPDDHFWQMLEEYESDTIEKELKKLDLDNNDS